MRAEPGITPDREVSTRGGPPARGLGTARAPSRVQWGVSAAAWRAVTISQSTGAVPGHSVSPGRRSRLRPSWVQCSKAAFEKRSSIANPVSSRPAPTPRFSRGPSRPVHRKVTPMTGATLCSASRGVPRGRAGDVPGADRGPQPPVRRPDAQSRRHCGHQGPARSGKAARHRRARPHRRRRWTVGEHEAAAAGLPVGAGETIIPIALWKTPARQWYLTAPRRVTAAARTAG